MKAGRGVDCWRWVIGAFVFLAGNFRGWGARGPSFFQKVPENGPARFFLLQRGRIGMMGSAWPNQLTGARAWVSCCRKWSYNWGGLASIC